MPIIEFEGLAENLIPGVKELTDATVKLRSEVAATNDTIKKGAQESLAAEQKLGQTIEATAQSMTDLNKNTNAGVDAVKRSREEAAKLIATSKTLTVAQREAAAAAGGVTKEYKAIVSASKGMEKGPIAAAVATKSLRSQLREAREELDRIVEASDGKITPELIEAGKRAGQLQDRFADLNATVEAFNPDTKFRAALNIIGNLSGGIQAASSAMGLFGGESENVNKALLKVQQASAFFQGLQSFIGGLADNWKNLRSVIAASAVATRANTAAQVANAAGTTAVVGANTAAAASTGVLTGAFNALKAALLSNPITAIAVALLALGAAIVSVTSDTNDYAAATDDLIKKLDELSKSRFNDIDQKLRLSAIANEREALEAGETDAAKRRQKEKDYLAERAALVGKQLERELNLRSLIAEIESLAGKDTDSANQARQTALDKFNEYREDFKQGMADLISLEGDYTNTLIEDNNERKKSNEDAYKKRVKDAKEAADELARIEADLKKRASSAEFEQADPSERIELQRAAAIEELRVLEDKLKAANAAVGKGNKLTVEQEVQLADVRLAIQLQYEKDRQALELKFAADRIALIADTGERERAAFDLQLAAQIKALEEAGGTELDIERFAAKRREDFRAGQVEKAIAQEEALALAKIDAIQKGAETEAQFRIRIELLKLQTQEEFAQQRLEALKEQTGEEVELTRAQLEAVLAEIVRKRAEIAANVPDVDIFSLLGLNLTDEQKKRVTDDLKTIGQAVQDAVLANIASQQQGVQAQLDATEQIIEDQRSRKDDLIALLDEELEAQKNGFANNADAVRAEIQAVTDAENAALANRKKLVEEQKKLAAQQAKVESALQIAALLTANAYLLKDGALKGVPGTIAAIAFAISLIGTFASIRAKVRAANADTPAFWEGTTYVDKDRKHRTGRDTVPAMLTRGEAVIPVAPNSKYPKLVEGLVENDFAKMQRAAIEELLTGTGVTLKQDRVREIVRTNEKAQSMTIVDRGPDKALLRRVDELTTLLASFKTQEGSKPTTSSDGGRSVVTTPTRTVKRR